MSMTIHSEIKRKYTKHSCVLNTVVVGDMQCSGTRPFGEGSNAYLVPSLIITSIKIFFVTAFRNADRSLCSVQSGGQFPIDNRE